MMKTRYDIKLEKFYKEQNRIMNDTLEYLKYLDDNDKCQEKKDIDDICYRIEEDRMVLRYLAYGKLMELILDRSNKIFTEAIEISRRQDADAMGNFFLINNMFPEDIIREMIKRCGVVMGCESKEVDLTQWIELISSTNQ